MTAVDDAGGAGGASLSREARDRPGCREPNPQAVSALAGFHPMTRAREKVRRDSRSHKASAGRASCIFLTLFGYPPSLTVWTSWYGFPTILRDGSAPSAKSSAARSKRWPPKNTALGI